MLLHAREQVPRKTGHQRDQVGRTKSRRTQVFPKILQQTGHWEC